MITFYWASSATFAKERRPCGTIEAIDAEFAAEELAERQHADNDYPETQDFWIWGPGEELKHFVVRAEPAVEFYATEVPE